jgi:hypothetical protein
VNVTEEKVIALAPERILHLLSEGRIEVEGLIPWSSNATLLVTVRDDELTTLAIYKPPCGTFPTAPWVSERWPPISCARPWVGD